MALSGRLGHQITDGDSPYTKALAEIIRRPGLDIFQTFNQVGLTVKRSTGGAQQPWGVELPNRRHVFLRSEIGPTECLLWVCVTIPNRDYTLMTSPSSKRGSIEAYLYVNLSWFQRLSKHSATLIDVD
jgi:hypothetical protein